MRLPAARYALTALQRTEPWPPLRGLSVELPKVDDRWHELMPWEFGPDGWPWRVLVCQTREFWKPCPAPQVRYTLRIEPGHGKRGYSWLLYDSGEFWDTDHAARVREAYPAGVDYLLSVMLELTGDICPDDCEAD